MESVHATPAQPGPALLTAAEVAARLRVSRRTLKYLVKTGQFPAPLRYSKLIVRWPEAEVAAYLARVRADRQPVAV